VGCGTLQEIPAFLNTKEKDLIFPQLKNENWQGYPG
jgi:hypothetical protein